MKIETGVREEKRRKDREKVENGEKMVRKKICRRPRCRVEAANTAIQRLFMACKEVFKGPGTIPTPHDVHTLQLLLDSMKADDVGLSSDLLFFKASSAVEGRPRITCTTIYQCANFSMCIFFLPPTAVIPLHNHPGMTVFSKLLLGSMHIKSYDWVDPSTSDDPKPSSSLKLARLLVDSDFTAPCRTSILYPTSGGNIHTFTAITSCAVLDILGPPYSKDDGRDCTYYKDHPWSSSSSDGGVVPQAGESADHRYRYLEEIEIPKDLKMNAVEYLGPQIIDD